MTRKCVYKEKFMIKSCTHLLRYIT